MDRPDLRRVVRIVTPGRFLGSGFRVSATRVLTSWHVVKGDPTELVVEDPRGSRWQPQEAAVVWPANASAPPGDLDAALLSTDPVDVGPWRAWRKSPIDGASDFMGQGFTRHAMEPKDRLTLEGRIAPYQEGEDACQLTVNDLETRDVKEGFGGLSGSGIFAEDGRRWTLCAVIRQAPEIYEGSVIHAVPVSELLRAEGFAEALDLPRERVSTAGFREKIASRLNSETLEALRDGLPDASLGDVAHCADYLCRHEDPGELAQDLTDLILELRRDGRDGSAGRVEEILHLALPATLATRIDRAHPVTFLDSSATTIRVNGSTDLQAELHSAALDGGPMRLSAPQRGLHTEFPRPSYQVPLEAPYEEGIDPSREKLEGLAKELATRLAFLYSSSGSAADRRAQQTLVHYIARLCTGDWKTGNPRLFRHSLLRTARRKAPENTREHAEALVELVNDLLELDFESAGRRFYYLAEAEGEHGARLLEDLKNHFPQLRGIELDGSGDTKTELRISRLFQEIFLARGGDSEEENEE